MVVGSKNGHLLDSTLGANGVLYADSSGVVTSTSAGAAGTVFAGSAGAPSFTATPTLTSISFGGSALGTYAALTAFTPTLTGATTAGTTTYNVQVGFYIRIGDLVICFINLNISAATGTGNIKIGGLPFTINPNGNYVSTGATTTNFTLPAGSTYAVVFGNANTTTAGVVCGGSASGLANVSIENASRQLYSTFIYSV